MCSDCMNLSLQDCISGMEDPENDFSGCICNTTGETRKILLSMGGFVQSDRESSVDISNYVKSFCSDLSPIPECEIPLPHSHTPLPELFFQDSNCEMCEIPQSLRCEISPDSECEIICPYLSPPSPLPDFPAECPVERACVNPTPPISPPPPPPQPPPPDQLWETAAQAKEDQCTSFPFPSPLPRPEVITLNQDRCTVQNVNAKVSGESENKYGNRRIFCRVKLFRRPIMTYGLVDTGNLSRCLISENLWLRIKAPLKDTRQRLRSADGSDMQVLGAIDHFKIYLEEVSTPIEIVSPLVVRGLTVPINIGIDQIEAMKASIDCTRAPANVLRFLHEESPLYSLTTPYLCPSKDPRFQSVINQLKTLSTKVEIGGKQVPYKATASSISHAQESISPALARLIKVDGQKKQSPSNEHSAAGERARATPPEKILREVQESDGPMRCGFPLEGRRRERERASRGRALHSTPAPAHKRRRENPPDRSIGGAICATVTSSQGQTGLSHTSQPTGDYSKIEKGKFVKRDATLRVCDFSVITYPIYLKYTTPLPPDTCSWVTAKIGNFPKCTRGKTLPVLITGDNHRNFYQQNLVGPVSGVYNAEVNEQTVQILVSNRNECEITLPCSLKLGTLQKAETLQKYEIPEETGESEEVCQVDHRPVEELNEAEKEERIQFLRQNVNLDESIFNSRQKEELFKILYRHFGAISVDADDFGHTTTEEFKITLNPGAVPVRDKCRPLNPKYMADLDRQLKEWSDSSVIEPSSSPWASALVPVRKKGTDKLRWAVDYRRLNDNIQTDAYPLPSIETNLQLLHNSKIYTTLDSAGAFHGIPVAPASRPLTAFTSPRGLFQFKRMPFGIKSSPSVYARMVARALDTLPGKPGEFALGYLDDIICHSKSPEDHLRHLELVMEMHEKAGMKVKLKKCFFGHARAEYLGHVVSEKGIQMNPSYVRRVVDWPLPATVAELRSFLGTVSYYRSFFPDFANLTSEMESMKSQRSKLIWQPDVIAKFERLKQLFIKEPIRAYPDFSPTSGKFILETDFSATARSAVLLQEDPKGGPNKFLGCCAAKNDTAAANYSSNKGELAAVILGLKKFEHLLSWKPFTIITDNACVSFLRNLKTQKGIYSRWKEILASFDFDIIHRPGRSHFFADSLSRRTDLNQEDDIEDEIAAEILDVYNIVDELTLPEDANLEGFGTIPLGELQAETAADPVLSKVLPFIRRGTPPDATERRKLPLEVLPYINRFPTLFLRHKVLMAYTPGGVGEDYTPKICVPTALKEKIFTTAHGGNSAGHHGISRTLDLLRTRVYFPRMQTYVEEKIKGCNHCFQKWKTPPAKSHPQHREIVGRPGARIYIDLVGPLNAVPHHGEDVSYILTILDGFTRYLTAVPLKTITAHSVLEGFLHNYVYKYGIPETVHTDNGVQFISATFQKAMEMYQISHTFTPTYTPEGNRVERYHRTLASMLRCENITEGTWAQKLDATVFALNSATNRITGISPFEATFGRPARIPLDVILPPETKIEEEQSLFEHVRDLKSRLTAAYGQMREHEEKAVQRETARDMLKTPVQFKVGDRVSVFSPRPVPKLAKKLQPHWKGPFLIIKLISPSLIRVRPEGTWSKSLQAVDVTPDRLKKWTCLPTSEQLHTPSQELDPMEDFSDEIDVVPLHTEPPPGLGPDGRPPRPVHVLPGPSGGNNPVSYQPVIIHQAPPPIPIPLPLQEKVLPAPDLTLQPTTAFPDITLPADSSAPPFVPVQDEVIPETPEFPQPQDESSPKPDPDIPPPLTPPPLPRTNPPHAARKELQFTLPPTLPLEEKVLDELEQPLDPLPAPSSCPPLPAPDEMPPDDPPLPPANPPPPPPLPPNTVRPIPFHQRLLRSATTGAIPKVTLPPLRSSPRTQRRLPPKPPPRKISEEIETVHRPGDVPHPTISSGVKRQKPEDEDELDFRTTRQRVGTPSLLQRLLPSPADPGRSRPSRSFETTTSPSRRERSRSKKRQPP